MVISDKYRMEYDPRSKTYTVFHHSGFSLGSTPEKETADISRRTGHPIELLDPFNSDARLALWNFAVDQKLIFWKDLHTNTFFLVLPGAQHCFVADFTKKTVDLQLLDSVMEKLRSRKTIWVELSESTPKFI